MVVRYAWGTCNADERYPERLGGGRFVKFPTPKSDIDKCKRWIKACGRPHEQLNLDRINKHKAVCSKHFVGSDGPSCEFPDPVPADGTRCTPARKKPKRRILLDNAESSNKHLHMDMVEDNKENDTSVSQISTSELNQRTCSTQTENKWIDAMVMLALVSDNASLKMEVEKKDVERKNLNKIIVNKDSLIATITKKLEYKACFGVDLVLAEETKVKNIFKYYTGIIYIRFLALLTFLLPEQSNMQYRESRTDIKEISKADGLFLTLCRLRHAFGLKDLATRFGVPSQSAGILFDSWIQLMYFKLGQMSIWPLRDIIRQNMPVGFKRDFPTSLIIIDGTEITNLNPMCSRSPESAVQ